MSPIDEEASQQSKALAREKKTQAALAKLQRKNSDAFAKSQKKLLKTAQKIVAGNEKIVLKQLNVVMKESRNVLSKLSAAADAEHYEILLHRDTVSDPTIESAARTLFAQISKEHSHITVFFDPHPEVQPNKPVEFINHSGEKATIKRRKYCCNRNRVLMRVDWQMFIHRQQPQTLRSHQPQQQHERFQLSGTQAHLSGINRSNQERLTSALNRALSQSVENTDRESTKHRVVLSEQTFANPVTRDYAHWLAQSLVEKHRGLVEINLFERNHALITVYWRLYWSQLAREQPQQAALVPLVDFSGTADQGVAENMSFEKPHEHCDEHAQPDTTEKDCII